MFSYGVTPRVLALSTLFHFLYSLQILFCLHPSFLFASNVFCLHPIIFVCILSFMFASNLFCLHRDRFSFFDCIPSFLFASHLFCLYPIFFVCSNPFFIVLTLVGHRTYSVEPKPFEIDNPRHHYQIA